MKSRPGGHPRRLCLAALFTAAFALLSISSPTSAQTPNQLDFGIAVPSGQPGPLAAVETEIGRQVDFVRIFTRWDDNFPVFRDRNVLEERDMALSVRPQTADGSLIPWADIAAAQPGDPLHNDMVEWARAIKPFEDQIYFTFHHEPEAVSNIAHGDASDFIAAWRAFMTVLDDEGVETLGRVWTATDFGFQVPDNDRRAANSWYPGDAWVDVIATDAYNWFNCRDGINSPWYDLEQIIEGLRLFGLEHPSEHLMLLEFGSAEDPADPNRKAEWFTDAEAMFARPEYSQFIGAAYFNIDDIRTGFNCRWSFDTSPISAAGFRALANSTTFAGAPTPAPTPAPAPASVCQATVTASGVTLNWTTNVTPTVIRKNGGWHDTVQTGQTFTDPTGTTADTYQIRIRPPGAGIIDHPCVVV